MRILASGAALAVACLLLPAAWADEPAGDRKKKTYQIPYKMTLAKHIVVRAKINGKGPFNFILDTGAPALFVATAVARKAGVRPEDDGWASLKKFEIEGGLIVPATKARIETPFQLEGMNGMGLAGVEIHGLIGFSVLAGYRMEIDFTRDKMVWTTLEKKTGMPFRLGGKGGGQGGLEVFGQVMAILGKVLGRRPAPEVALRGFLGMTLVDGDEFPRVERVLESGPAGKAGLRAGDVLRRIQDRGVSSVSDVLRFARRIKPGDRVTLTIQRGKESKDISFKSTGGI